MSGIMLNIAGGSFGPPPGQQAYVTAGTFTWVAPAGVTKVSVVVVGAGGNGGGSGGGGGGLAYRNNFSVTPGGSYTVVAGDSVASPGQPTRAGTSSFNSTSPAATGGVNASQGGLCFSGGAPCGTYTGGNTGGAGVAASFGGGGGAAGYSGNGGASTGSTGSAGTGGAGGGGVSGVTYTFCCCTRQGGGSGGGGVGLLGQGSSGGSTAQAGGSCTQAGGKGGSSGANGDSGQGNSAAGNGGANGGGGGGGGSTASSRGGYGAVRIIWPGCARSFPSTRTANE